MCCMLSMVHWWLHYLLRKAPLWDLQALYGLLGATLSALIQNWELYTNKFTALASVLFVAIGNFLLGLLPYVVNFSNIGGSVSGFLLGSVLLSSPQFREFVQGKGGLLDYNRKSTIKSRLRQKYRSVSFSLCTYACWMSCSSFSRH